MRRALRYATAVVVVTSIGVGATPPAATVAKPGRRDCGVFRTKTFTGARTRIRARVHRGPVGCRAARRVLRYAITHRKRRGNDPFGSPRGWDCARGGPGIRFTVEGYSCEAQRPRRIVTGRFLG